MADKPSPSVEPSKNSLLALTENSAIAYASTGNACLDLFFKMVRGLNTSSLHIMLDNAWNESPESVLRIIFHCRDCRGGKGEKKLFYDSLVWLFSKQPETVKKNLSHIPFFGTWKDLLVIATQCFPLAPTICELFANQLLADKELLQAKNNGATDTQISLCAKWAPSERHKFDSETQIGKQIARLLFRREVSSDQEKRACYRNYRTNFLVPLREHLRVTERYMCSNDWNHIPYPAVASRCMHLNKRAFAKKDSARFTHYLEAALAGKTTLKGKQMFPHELVRQYMIQRTKYDPVIELQWKSILEPLRESGILGSSIVLSDVSGSMSGTPMEVSIALGLLISELTAPPFQNLIITFDTIPTLHQVQGETLLERVQNVAGMPWGGSTDFRKALQLILDHAIKFKIPPAEMPQKLFVISDMQFNEADDSFLPDDLFLQQIFRDAGYEIPVIVYWNVRANTISFPSTGECKGVVLLSGFSPSLLKLVLEESNYNQQWDMELGDGPAPERNQPNPLDILRNAIFNERYNILQL